MDGKFGTGPTPGTKYAPRTNDYARPGANKPIAFENTADPLDVLKYMGQIERNGIFWLKDFAPHLEDPKSSGKYGSWLRFMGL